MRSKDTSARTIGLIGLSVLLHGAAFWSFNENLTLKRVAEIIEETHQQANKSEVWEKISTENQAVEVQVEPSSQIQPTVQVAVAPTPPPAKSNKVVKAAKVETKTKTEEKIATELPQKENLIEKVAEVSIPKNTVVVDEDFQTEANTEVATVPPELKDVEETDLLSELRKAEQPEQSEEPQKEEKQSAFQKLRSYLGLKQVAGNQPPQYPIEAREQGLQGRVLLKYFITETGDIEDISITESSGYKVLDEEALRAISSYRFYPGQEGWAEHPVKFSLKGLRDEVPSDLGAAKTN